MRQDRHDFLMVSGMPSLDMINEVAGIIAPWVSGGAATLSVRHDGMHVETWTLGEAFTIQNELAEWAYVTRIHTESPDGVYRFEVLSPQPLDTNTQTGVESET